MTSNQVNQAWLFYEPNISIVKRMLKSYTPRNAKQNFVRMQIYIKILIQQALQVFKTKTIDTEVEQQ